MLETCKTYSNYEIILSNKGDDEMNSNQTVFKFSFEILSVLIVSAAFQFLLYITTSYKVLENRNFGLTLVTIAFTYPLAKNV